MHKTCLNEQEIVKTISWAIALLISNIIKAFLPIKYQEVCTRFI